MRYCSLISYFHNLIPNVANMIDTFALLRYKNCWNNTHLLTFDNMKQVLLNYILLAYLDMNVPLYMAYDASNMGIGAMFVVFTCLLKRITRWS